MRTTAGLTAIFGRVLTAEFLMAGRADAQNLTLKQEGGNTFLVEGKARLQIPNSDRPDTSAAIFHLPNGDTVTLVGDSVQVQTKAGQSGAISLTETLKQWVHDDSKWSGHAFENFLLGVYNHGGLTVSIGNAVVFEGSLLAILTTNSASGSGNVIESQQIVKIQTTPTPALQMVRFLAVPNTDAYAMPGYVPRLFVRDKKLLLFADPGSPDDYESLRKPRIAPRSHLAEIDADGKTLRMMAEFPRPLYPVGLVNNRWLVLGMTLITYPSIVPPLWLHDMQRHITTPLPVASKDYEGFGYIGLPDSGSSMPYMALQTFDGKGQKPGKVLVLHLPDGRRVATLPGFRTTGCSVLFWNNQVVTVDIFLHRIAVYEAQTGRPVKTFALPAALKAGIQNAVTGPRPDAAIQIDQKQMQSLSALNAGPSPFAPRRFSMVKFSMANGLVEPLPTPSVLASPVEQNISVPVVQEERVISLIDTDDGLAGHSQWPKYLACSDRQGHHLWQFPAQLVYPTVYPAEIRTADMKMAQAIVIGGSNLCLAVDEANGVYGLRASDGALLWKQLGSYYQLGQQAVWKQGCFGFASAYWTATRWQDKIKGGLTTVAYVSAQSGRARPVLALPFVVQVLAVGDTLYVQTAPATLHAYSIPLLMARQPAAQPTRSKPIETGKIGKKQ